MPFQLISSAFNQVSCTAFTFSAGPDQPAICSTTITLTATVVESLVGHTVFWEQILGPTNIVYTTPQNQLIVMYTTTTFFDRTFRFYIDKGTPCEVSDDVTIFGTPTSLTYVNNAGSGGAGTLGQVLGEYGGNPRGRRPTVNALRFFPPTYNITGQGGCTGTLWAISWTEPEQPQLLNRYIVQQLIGPTFVDLATILPTQPRMYFAVVDQGIYRVIAEYNNALLVDDLGNILSLHPSQAVYLTTDPHLEGVDIEGSSPSVVGSLPGSINNVKVISYVTTFITIHICDNFTDIPETDVGAFSNIVNSVKVLNYSTTLLTLGFCDNFTDIPETDAGAFSNIVNSVRIINYTVTNLGGGSIGG